MKLKSRNILLSIGLSLVALLTTVPASATVLNVSFGDGLGDTAIGWVDLGSATSGGVGADSLNFSLNLTGSTLFGSDSGTTLTGITSYTSNGDALCVSGTSIVECATTLGLRWGTSFDDGTRYLEYYFDTAGTAYLGFTDTSNQIANWYPRPTLLTSVKSPVPEPEPPSLALLGIGLVGLGVNRKRKHKTRSE